MLIDQINLNHIRIFESVFRTGSMTLAADELSLTQSGVSQHIKSLEDVLRVRLFDRINQRLVPTGEAQSLFDCCSRGLKEIESGLSQVTGRDRHLAGVVNVGMPIEFGNNVIMPLLAKFSIENPHVKYNLKLDFANAMNESLLKGELDFAFVDTFAMDRRIKTEKVYDEVLELCIHPDLVKEKSPQKQTKQFFEKLSYVDYQVADPLVRMWFAHHLKAKHIDLNVRAHVMDVQGIANLIVNKVGAGILPTHYVDRLEREGVKLTKFKGNGKDLLNAISVAYLEQRSHSVATTTLLKFLKEALKSGGQAGL